MRIKSCMEINVSTLANNYQLLKEICPNNEALFMVKANAYGHGMVPIVKFAYFELGIKEFGCASIGEALRLREEIPNGEFEVYVFSDVNLDLQEAADIYLNNRIIPVLSNESNLKYFLEQEDFRYFPLCLKFNTGMNRLGLRLDRIDEVVKLIKASGRKSIYHLMSHFSSSSLSMDKNKRNLAQKENWRELKSQLLASGIEIDKSSLANSGAIEQKVGLEETHVRPGLMMYGPTSLLPQYSHLSCWQGKLISRLETTFINSFKVDRGTPIGYGATPCPTDGVVGIFALGYGDGFSTRYQNVHLRHGKEIGQIVGRVNMDMGQILFNNQDLEIKNGERFVVWDQSGENFSNICLESKTIPYEVFIHLTERIPKIYRQ
ncbi:alanine racemase [Halobacteriovorax sp. XZX-3]|uniref:alanine racemase n=1 Tax=unclassified Halobacteriovorax TaxID=2639665 RepID=UPI000CD1CB4E|nr:alanine racemase [Halobacteriovorax sp. DA5]POB13991.1 alanine racemase [Halobacteriovorax sp. DA5]